MPEDRIRAAVEVTGLIAVVISLLLLAYEVRQSNRIAEATTTYEIGRDVNQFNELGYTDAEFASFLLQLSDEGAQLSDVQALQARLLANRFINIWTIEEKAYRNGLLTEAQFEMTKQDVLTVMTAFPRLRDPWRAVFRSQPGLKEFVVLKPLYEALPE